MNQKGLNWKHWTNVSAEKFWFSKPICSSGSLSQAHHPTSHTIFSQHPPEILCIWTKECATFYQSNDRYEGKNSRWKNTGIEMLWWRSKAGRLSLEALLPSVLAVCLSEERHGNLRFARRDDRSSAYTLCVSVRETIKDWLKSMQIHGELSACGCPGWTDEEEGERGKGRMLWVELGNVIWWFASLTVPLRMFYPSKHFSYLPNVCGEFHWQITMSSASFHSDSSYCHYVTVGFIHPIQSTGRANKNVKIHPMFLWLLRFLGSDFFFFCLVNKLPSAYHFHVNSVFALGVPVTVWKLCRHSIYYCPNPPHFILLIQW